MAKPAYIGFICLHLFGDLCSFGGQPLCRFVLESLRCKTSAHRRNLRCNLSLIIHTYQFQSPNPLISSMMAK
ncbi:hypothetical protein F4803DRAFT_544266 [Xylaria telfairii]|nr:hypothetical protein F4803DRAFT_544266 [Xylaria telfairii]